jgi:hypothetical protein
VNKVYIIEHIVKKPDFGKCTYSRVSKISQEGYSSLKEAQNFCIKERGCKREITPFWYADPEGIAEHSANMIEYKIHEIIINK